MTLARSPSRGSDFDVAINEIHYNPLSGQPSDEFVEILNCGSSVVDIGGWGFNEGISFAFPRETLLAPGAFLVVSPNAPYTTSRYGISNVVGNYSGRLDNDGEIVALIKGDGTIISRVHYGAGGIWPSRPDGLGPSLELVDPRAPPDIRRSWTYSLFLDGTPGRANSRTQASPGERRTLIAPSGPWRFFKGTGEPSSPLAAWTGPSFDDSAWAEGQGGFGYGEYLHYRTELADMKSRYSTFYMRSPLTLSAADLSDVQNGILSLSLTVRYNDAFVAYLSGMEVGRDNAGLPGVPLPSGAVATSPKNWQATVRLDGAVKALAPGQHILAIQGVTTGVGAEDFLLEAELVLEPPTPPTVELPPPLVINEAKATQGEDPGFIELYNASEFGISLDGHAIVDSLGRRFSIPGAHYVSPGAWLAFPDSQLGFPVLPAEVKYALVKRSAAQSADEFVDALGPRAAQAGSPAPSLGRFPDGGDDVYMMLSPTPAEANRLLRSTDVVINEIYFHPPFFPPGNGCDADCSDALQWIELHNKGAGAVDLSGWSLSKGVELTFPSPTVIPGGGYLVVASSRASFLESHPGFDAAEVIGDWSQSLAHDSDTLNLNDELGNRVDHVKYGDGKPFNDLAPPDGSPPGDEPPAELNDGTFVGSSWPWESDGTGRTIELIHPGLDNRYGASWAAGRVGGTPGSVNESFQPTPSAVIDEVSHSPAVPRPDESVTIRCRVSPTQLIASVEVLWHVDGGGGGIVMLTEEETPEDGGEGSSDFSGRIPPQPEKSVVGFQLRAHLIDGKETTVPRAPPASPYPGFAGPFFLYQVVSVPEQDKPSESYFIVMTAADREELESRPATSDVLLPGTFIFRSSTGSEGIRYLAGVRYRGSQSRTEARKSYRVDFPTDRDFQGIQHLNLNAPDPECEILASDLFRRAGMPCPRQWAVSLTFQGDRDDRYACKEHLDSDFLNRFFGGASDSGNLYRAIHPEEDFYSGNLTYFGPDPASYAPYYDKATNAEESDYSDIVELCRVFDPDETPDEVFPEALEQLVDTAQWARFFALESCVANEDGGIQNLVGEDYFLYKVPADSWRADAGKWLLIPWDLNETFQASKEQLFPSQAASIRRFLRHPRFSSLYYASLVDLRNGVFSRPEMRKRLPLIAPLVNLARRDLIETFFAERNGYLDSAIPKELVAGATGGGIQEGLLIRVGEWWKYWKGTAPPAGASLDWTKPGYAETGWLSGATGIGYGGGDDATVLEDMKGRYSCVYVRKSFTVEDPAGLPSLELLIDYDDGFVAYLNSVEVARRNVAGAPGSIVSHNAVAQGIHPAGFRELVDLSAFRGSLVAGTNVMAIQILNSDRGSDGLSFQPELRGTSALPDSFGCGTALYATGELMELAGRANAALTRSIKIGGQLATYDGYTATWSATVPLAPGDNQILVEALDGEAGGGKVVESKTLIIRRIPRPPVRVHGTLVGVARWTEAEGPYFLVGEVIVPAGSVLEIGPGTVILGGSGASIIVRGEIRAVGTAEAPVLFRSLSCDSRVGGIALDNTGTSESSPTNVFEHCSFEYGREARRFNACVAPVSSKVRVDHCSFRCLTSNCIEADDARLDVRDSLFEKTGECVHCASSATRVVGCTFRNLVGDNDAMDLEFGSPGRSLIQGCTFEDLTDDALDTEGTSCDVRDNVFRRIADKALSLQMTGEFGQPTITGNLIYDAGTGISVKSGIRIAEGAHNTIVGCGVGLSFYLKFIGGDGGHGTFDSLIVWNCDLDVEFDSVSSASFSYSDFGGGPRQGVGNISIDPGFVDIRAHDYRLQPWSPCIGSGEDGTDMGAIPFQQGNKPFSRGDANSNGQLDIADAVYILSYLFLGGPAPPCFKSADLDDSGTLEITDPVYLLGYLFLGGPEPKAPFPGCAVDPTDDGLGCASHPACR